MSMRAGLRWIRAARRTSRVEPIPRISPLAGAIQTTNHGGQDAFVAKLGANGATLVYSTYLGGSGAATPEEANGIAVDASGNAYVAGVANSADFPVTAGAFQVNFNGVSDAFVTKINRGRHGVGL